MGQTPIDEDEQEGLLISTIATQAELNEFEQQNIEDALQWAMSRNFTPEQVFSERFVCEVHKRMFGTVWSWAGIFRTTNKNLGVDKHQISVELKKLLDDALYWVEHNTYTPDELAIRFKHHIVSIHCFPNGNGRHSRFMGDVIVEKLFGQEHFSWGAKNLSADNEARAAYLKAVRAADRGDFKPLLTFARS